MLHPSLLLFLVCECNHLDSGLGSISVPIPVHPPSLFPIPEGNAADCDGQKQHPTGRSQQPIVAKIW